MKGKVKKMEIRTSGITGKDVFNCGSSTPIKDVVGVQLNVVDIYVTDKEDGTTAGYLKTTDGQMYATISNSILGQLEGLAELLPATVVAVSKKSNSNRDYLMLELV